MHIGKSSTARPIFVQSGMRDRKRNAAIYKDLSVNLSEAQHGQCNNAEKEHIWKVKAGQLSYKATLNPALPVPKLKP